MLSVGWVAGRSWCKRALFWSPTRTVQPPSEELIREEFGDARPKIGTKSLKEKEYHFNTRHDSLLLLFREMQF